MMRVLAGRAAFGPPVHRIFPLPDRQTPLPVLEVNGEHTIRPVYLEAGSVDFFESLGGDGSEQSRVRDLPQSHLISRVCSQISPDLVFFFFLSQSEIDLERDYGAFCPPKRTHETTPLIPVSFSKFLRRIGLGISSVVAPQGDLQKNW